MTRNKPESCFYCKLTYAHLIPMFNLNIHLCSHCDKRFNQAKHSANETIDNFIKLSRKDALEEAAEHVKGIEFNYTYKDGYCDKTVKYRVGEEIAVKIRDLAEREKDCS